MRALVAGGADPNALEAQRYDVVTIAAVRDDVATLRLGLALGARPGNVTSPYDGTALIASAHLGHVDVVRILIDAGAPLDHVNNLGWTALLEAVILGDGGPRHVAVLRMLVAARRRRRSRRPSGARAARSRPGTRVRGDGRDPGGRGPTLSVRAPLGRASSGRRTLLPSGAGLRGLATVARAD